MSIQRLAPVLALAFVATAACSSAPDSSQSTDEPLTGISGDEKCIYAPVQGTIGWTVPLGCRCEGYAKGSYDWEFCNYQAGLAHCLGVFDCDARKLPTLEHVADGEGAHRRDWALVDLDSKDPNLLHFTCGQLAEVQKCVVQLNAAKSPIGTPYASNPVSAHFDCVSPGFFKPGRCGLSLSERYLDHDPCPGSCVGYGGGSGGKP